MNSLMEAVAAEGGAPTFEALTDVFKCGAAILGPPYGSLYSDQEHMLRRASHRRQKQVHLLHVHHQRAVAQPCCWPHVAAATNSWYWPRRACCNGSAEHQADCICLDCLMQAA
jgi:hypothetical protein